jgi:hypothetical protein
MSEAFAPVNPSMEETPLWGRAGVWTQGDGCISNVQEFTRGAGK